MTNERNINKEITFAEMLADDDEDILDDVIIKCSCGSKNIKISEYDGVSIICKDCGMSMNFGFIKLPIKGTHND